MQTLFKLSILLLLLLVSAPAVACFGPKLYVGTPGGMNGELLFHLAAIYVQEKTGVESVRIEYAEGETAGDLLQREKIDLGFSPSAIPDWSSILTVGDTLHLLSGTRPIENLQFTTVPKALKKLQRLLTREDLALLQQQVENGMLPAKAVRNLYMQRGWI
ncbi:hypothetical protein [Malonomonas rubra]|uniref:hypothetical protein n=1 Tax=Malonomonas rubra TaxID=57040 RepID=UPI0026EA545E|nr:hypothetical protein [Malonomonas rubra]